MRPPDPQTAGRPCRESRFHWHMRVERALGNNIVCTIGGEALEEEFTNYQLRPLVPAARL